MRIKFIIKPPLKVNFSRELEKFKKDFSVSEVFTDKVGVNNAGVLAKAAVEQGFDRVVVAGGDGLLNESVNGIMGVFKGEIPRWFAVGVIPTGTGVDFAKALRISLRMNKAFSVLKGNNIKRVDLGRVNGRYFVNSFSCGFDAVINRRAVNIGQKYRFLKGRLTYPLAALREITKGISSYHMKITGGNINMDKDLVFAAITNSSTYGAIFKINPQAEIDDGKLDVCLVERAGKFSSFANVLRVINGTHTVLPEIKIFKTTFLKIESRTVLPYEIDGELPAPESWYEVKVYAGVFPFLVP